MTTSEADASAGVLRPDLDDTFWTIVTGDDQWVRAEFDAIIAAGWDSPPPPPPPAPPQPGQPQPGGQPPVHGWRPCYRRAEPPTQPCRHDQRSPPR